MEVEEEGDTRTDDVEEEEEEGEEGMDIVTPAFLAIGLPPVPFSLR